MPSPSPKAFVLSPAASSPVPPSLAHLWKLHLGRWPRPSSVTPTAVPTARTQGAAASPLSSPDSGVSGESMGGIQAWSPLTTVWPWTSCGLLEPGCPAAPPGIPGRGGGSGARAVEGALVLSFLGRGWGQLPASPEFSFLPASQDH